MDPLKTPLIVDHWDEHLTLEQLVELQKKAYRIFYFRLSNIWSQVKRIRSFHQIKVKTVAMLKILGIDFGTFKFKSKFERQIE